MSLGDPEDPDSGATLYRFSSGEGTVVELITGKSRSAGADANQQEVYVRLPDAPESWLVQGDFVSASKSVDWLDTTIVEIDRADINRIQIDHPGDESVEIESVQSASAQFVLQNIPEDYQIRSDFVVNDLVGAFSSLDFSDVRADQETDYSNGITATLDTQNGLRVRMQMGVLNEANVARFVAMEGPVSTGTDSEKETEAETANDSESTESEQPVEDTIAELNKRWSGWVYEVRSFKLQNITRKKSEYIEPVPEEPAPQTGDAPTAGPQDTPLLAPGTSTN